MPFNISTFKTELAQYGTVQTNKFQVYITPPSNMLGKTISTPSGNGALSISTTSISQRLLLRAEDVNVPSVSLAVSDVFRYGPGISEKMPFNSTMGILNLTFIADDYGIIWQFWYEWLKSIFNFSGSDNGKGGLTSGSGSYVLDYKDNYSTIISVIIYDNYGRIVQTNDYTRAFPFGLNDIRLNWNTDNQLLKITVALAFTDYTIVGSNLNNFIEVNN